jgi:mono/diheme cytochrome c family protein
MKRVLFGLLLLWQIPSARSALPGDVAEGQRLHDANCLSCHDTSIYTRKDRAIHSLDALKHQVEGCGHLAKKEFSAAQRQDIVKYLDERFYHFQ